MKLTTKQIKQIIKEEMRSFMKEVEYHNLDLSTKQEIPHKRILSQIIKGRFDPSQYSNLPEATQKAFKIEIEKAIQEFNLCVDNDYLSPEERSGGEFDHLFDRGDNVDCFDHASDMAKGILKKWKGQ
tara:strand:- start:123 stop:503 length:381 start_codon:yes stop_codon:yes gene_type:complete